MNYDSWKPVFQNSFQLIFSSMSYISLNSMIVAETVTHFYTTEKDLAFGTLNCYITVFQFLKQFCFSVKTGKWLIWSSLTSFDGSAVAGGIRFTRFCGTGESLEGCLLLQDNGLETFPALRSDSAISVWNASKVNWSFFEILCCCIWSRYSNQLLVADIPMP